MRLQTWKTLICSIWEENFEDPRNFNLPFQHNPQLDLQSISLRKQILLQMFEL